MKKKQTYYSLFLILIIGVAIILGISFLKSGSKSVNQSVLSNRTFTGSLPTTIITKEATAFRIDRTAKELVLIAEDKARIFSTNNSVSYSIPTNEAWNAFAINDSLFIYGERNNSLYAVHTNTLKKIMPVDSADDNVLFTGDHLFYGNELSKPGTKYQIRDLKNPAFACNITNALDQSLQGIDSICQFNFLEGILVDHDQSSFLFLPYRLSSIAIINKLTAKVTLVKSIDPRKRVNLASIETKMPNGGVMITCQPIDGVDILQNAATTSTKYLYILTTSVIDTLQYQYQVVDVYKKHSLEYLFSLKIKLPDKQRYFLDMEWIKDELFFLDNQGEVSKTSYHE